MDFKKLVFGLSLIVSFNVNAQTSFAPLVDELMPAVVSISTNITHKNDTPNVRDDLIYENYQREILGSGFVFSDDGYIVTNAHVISDADTISVITNENDSYNADIVGIDEKTDIALIKVNSDKKLNSVVLGNSDEVNVGDWVLAIGNPFGLGNSVTAGIISAKSRDIGDNSYNDYFQTDASINQGNSGGPMFNINGEVIGINSAIFSASGNGVGVGFALPSNDVAWIINQLKNNKKVVRSWLGIELKPVKTKNNVYGLVITSALDEKIVKNNGLEVGDIILEINKEQISSPKKFMQTISKLTPETDAELTLWRNNNVINQIVKVKISPNKSLNKKILLENGEYIQELGIYIVDNKITAFDKQSQLKLNGATIGDKIIKVNNEPIKNAETLKFYISIAKSAKENIVLDMEDTNQEMYFIELNI